MPSLSENLSSPTPLNAALLDGVNTLSNNQEIIFTKYVRCVLPLDGFVFWVKADILGPGSLYNSYAYNTPAYDTQSNIVTPAATISAQGSFHFATEQRQEEEQTMAVNQVVFTSKTMIQDLNVIAPNVLYIGEFNGIRFAFSKRDSYYQQANIHHYVGHAIYSVMESQIIDDVRDFDSINQVVSNSLPVWLSLNKFMPVYPSYAVPANTEPLFATAHIEASETQAIQASPYFDNNGSHYQLTKDKVKITIYGLRNFNALDYVDYVSQFTVDNNDIIGISNMPVARDEKKTQAELNTLAIKKSVIFDVNYYQSRINDIARQLILTVIPTFYPQQLVKSVAQNSLDLLDMSGSPITDTSGNFIYALG